MFVLDTNVVSELRKGRHGRANPHVVNWAEEADPATLYISAVTVLELETGVFQMERKDTKQGAALRSWLHDQVLAEFKDRVLTIDTAVARRCANLHVLDPRSGRGALIAATALVHGMVVVTRNATDFIGTGVGLLNPWEPTFRK